MFKFAVLANAASLIVVHNHPSGEPEPSKEDIEMTRRLVKAGEIMGIEILDHLIIGDGAGKKPQWVSLKERGVL